MKFIKRIISIFLKSVDDEVSVYSAQSAYYLVLSSIPFIMLLLSVAQRFIRPDKQAIINALPSVISPNLLSFVTEIVNEVFAKPMISLISVSAITTLWSASRGFAAMERGIKAVYGIPKRTFFLLDILLSFVYTIAFIAALLFSIGVIGFGKTIISLLEGRITWLSINITILQYLLFFILIVLFFALIYTSFTSRKIPFRFHLPGALFTGGGWILFSYFFSIYINNFSNYSRIYGSLTAIVLLLLWVYSCMLILLYGAEINANMIQAKGISYQDNNKTKGTEDK